MKPSDYDFPGLWSFIDRADRDSEIRYGDKMHETWHFRQAQQVLAQIPKLGDYKSRRLAIYHAIEVRNSLGQLVKGIDNAISEVCEKFDLYDKD